MARSKTKKALFCALVAAVIITLGILQVHYWRIGMKKYVGESMYPDEIVDGTKFVLSGEYYFDCKKSGLVRREPLPFPIEKLHRVGKVNILHGSYPQYEPFLEAELARADFYRELTYHYTALTQVGHSVINYHVSLYMTTRFSTVESILQPA
jgi:hypothetical protein